MIRDAIGDRTQSAGQHDPAPQIQNNLCTSFSWFVRKCYHSSVFKVGHWEAVVVLYSWVVPAFDKPILGLSKSWMEIYLPFLLCSLPWAELLSLTSFSIQPTFTFAFHRMSLKLFHIASPGDHGQSFSRWVACIKGITICYFSSQFCAMLAKVWLFLPVPLGPLLPSWANISIPPIFSPLGLL